MPITLAAKYNDMELFKLLIKYGANVNCMNIDAMHGTEDNVDFEEIPLELEDFREGEYLEKYPINYAVENGNTEMVKLILDLKGNPNPVYDYNTMVEALNGEHFDIVALLSKAGIAFDTEVAHHAIRMGSIKAVEYLIEKGVKLEKEYNSLNEEIQPCSAISIAAAGGHVDMIKFLLKHGYKMTNSTLFHASYHDSIEVVDFLIDELHADVNYKTIGGTPYEIAVLEGKKKMAKHLLKKGAKKVKVKKPKWMQHKRHHDYDFDDEDW